MIVSSTFGGKKPLKKQDLDSMNASGRSVVQCAPFSAEMYGINISAPHSYVV